MITKERLQELIEQGATVYELFMDKEILKVELNKNYYIMLDKTYENKLGKLPQRPHWLSDLFETKEEAEWHKEFSCIERTERLELPTYEWMQPKEDEQDVYYSFYNYKHELMGIRVTKQKIVLYKSYRCSDLTSTVDIFDNTKENYTLACRKCKELFLGERNV